MSEKTLIYPNGALKPGSFELSWWRRAAFERGMDLGEKGTGAVAVIREALEVEDASIRGHLVSGFSSGYVDYVFTSGNGYNPLSQIVRRSFFWEMHKRMSMAVEEARRIQATG